MIDHLLRVAATVVAATILLALTGAPAQAAEPPSLSARSAIVVETSTGDVLFEDDAGAERSIASATKLMTALLVLERLDLDDVVVAAPYDASPVESVLGTRAGERYTARDLLTALMLASANDAAATFAKRISGSTEAFVGDMNDRAARLGLTATSFANPIGFDDPDNHSSAADLVKLTLALRRFAEFRRIVDLPTARITSGPRPRVIKNRNRLIARVGEVNGVKTGHTREAGYVLIGSATRSGVTVISAVLGDPSEATRDADTLALLRYGLGSYRRATVLEPGQILASASVNDADGDVRLLVRKGYERVLRTGLRPRVDVQAPSELEGPLPAGARVGSVVVRLEGRTLARLPLLTATVVPEPSATGKFGEWMDEPATLGIAGAVIAAGVALMLARRRRGRRTRQEVA